MGINSGFKGLISDILIFHKRSFGDPPVIVPFEKTRLNCK